MAKKDEPWKRWKKPCRGVEQKSNGDGECRTCGSRYHCSRCGRGAPMLGHWRGEGKPWSCEVEDGEA